MDRCDTLEPNHEAVIYLKGRMIPESSWHRVWYIPHVCDITDLDKSYKDRVVGREPRLVFPFTTHTGKIVGLCCRALGDHKLRYIVVRFNKDWPCVYGTDHVSGDDEILVFEGPIDSLFFENSLAVGGFGFQKSR